MTDKPSSCEACPRFSAGFRCVASAAARTAERQTILWVYTQPEQLDMNTIEPGISGAVFSVTSTALHRLYRETPARQSYHIRRTYAVQCTPEEDGDKPRASVLAPCQANLEAVIAETKPVLIVSFGATALKQLGIKQKHSTVRGRVLESSATGLSAPLLVTFSEQAVANAAGIHETFLQDLRNGFRRLETGEPVQEDLEVLSAKYRHPTTIDEALAVLRHIETLPENVALSVDTETTSLRPEKDGAKIIAFPLAWGPGEATTILFDHPHAPEGYVERLPELHAAVARVLNGPHPKIFHNAKFDLKWIELKYRMPVNNVAWCTLCGEHLLDEDKKGNYGLKALTPVWLPKYVGYEDKLYDFISQEEDDPLAAVMAKLELVPPEYAHYRKALQAYHDELVAYLPAEEEWQAAKRRYDIDRQAYVAARKEYKAAKDLLDASKPPRTPRKPVMPGKDAPDTAFEEYFAALAHYDASKAAHAVWKGLPRPTFDVPRPVEPLRPKRPQEPKDPRSKKEIEYTTDAGFEKVPLAELQLYGSVDADVTRRLSSCQLARLRAEGATVSKPISPCVSLMKSHAIPASRVLGAMEYHGTTINLARVAEMEEQLTRVIERSSAALHQMAPGVNINSGPALAVLLYETGWTHPDGGAMPAVECLLLTAKKQRSTSVGALAPYIRYEDAKDADGNLVPKRESLFLHTLFQYRKAIKARDTFLANIRILSSRDGKIHTSFHLNGTGTGRLSSSDMNLQNIPKVLAGVNLKNAFVPDNDNDFVVVNADYKGAEVRVFTAYAPDPALIKALNDGLDMHSFFASRVFNNPYDDYQNRGNDAAGLSESYRRLLDKQRTQIKRVVFGILYGAGPQKISETIGVDLDEGKALIELLFTMFPAIRAYIDRVKYLVARDGYVDTLFNRRRRFPLQATSRHRGRAERQACNFKIQSTSSDIVISQLVEIHEAIMSEQTWPEWGIHRPLHTCGVRILLTVHDSIVLQWPKALLASLTPWLTYYGETRVRERYPWLPVPFSMDIEVGASYGSVTSLEKYLKAQPAPKVEHELDEALMDESEAMEELRKDAFEYNAA